MFTQSDNHCTAAVSHSTAASLTMPEHAKQAHFPTCNWMKADRRATWLASGWSCLASAPVHTFPWQPIYTTTNSPSQLFELWVGVSALKRSRRLAGKTLPTPLTTGSNAAWLSTRAQQEAQITRGEGLGTESL